MNRYLPIWGKITLLCLVSALSLGLVHWGVSFRIHKQETQTFETLLSGWKADAKIGKNLTVGAERVVPSMRFVKSCIPLRGIEGKTELFLVRLFPGGYVNHYQLLAAYTKEGKLIGCIVEKEIVHTVSTYSKPSSALLKVLVKGRWISRASGMETLQMESLQREEIDAISGATFTFLSLVEALQEGAFFVIRGGKRS